MAENLVNLYKKLKILTPLLTGEPSYVSYVPHLSASSHEASSAA